MIPSKAELKKICREWVINQIRENHFWDAVFDELEFDDEESDRFFESSDRREAESETADEIVEAIEALEIS